jgi:lipooligosaccharide transport system ATP-binding protein
VTKRFGERTAVDGLDLDVARAGCFGLLGPNGAGKTTALRMVYGVTRPTAGSVRVFGLDVAREPRAVRARLGVTLQQNVLIEALSPLENLYVFGRYHGLREGILRRRAAELVEELELASHANAPARTLSGGMQRRLAIALSLMNRPELLILDEPTTGLDPQVRLVLWERVRRLRESGTTVLVTTHYMEEAERLCDRIAVMAFGRLRAEGTRDELVARFLAPEAIEVACDASDEAGLRAALGAEEAHSLRVGERLVLYADDTRRWLEALRRHDGGDRRPVVLRPTNLEDVFLALTGTHLGDSEA